MSSLKLPRKSAGSLEPAREVLTEGSLRSASLPAILNIFSLWLVLFLVWAIFYLEVFGLTRWRTYGTPYQNYSHFLYVAAVERARARADFLWDNRYAMVMLAIQSTGYVYTLFILSFICFAPKLT